MFLATKSDVDKKQGADCVTGKTSSSTCTSNFYLLPLKEIWLSFVPLFCFLSSWLSFSGHLLHFRQELNAWQTASHLSLRTMLAIDITMQLPRWRSSGSEGFRNCSSHYSLWPSLFLPAPPPAEWREVFVNILWKLKCTDLPKVGRDWKIPRMRNGATRFCVAWNTPRQPCPSGPPAH
jgi:hypothetical protein